MRREEMVGMIAGILPYHWRTNPPGGQCSCGYETLLGRQTSEHVAQLVLDAILPQVTTVAELDALAVGSIVTDGDGGVWRRDADRWWDRPGSVACSNSAALHDDAAPLTVVWQPEAATP